MGDRNDSGPNSFLRREFLLSLHGQVHLRAAGYQQNIRSALHIRQNVRSFFKPCRIAVTFLVNDGQVLTAQDQSGPVESVAWLPAMQPRSRWHPRA